MGLKVEGLESTKMKLSRVHKRTSKRQLKAFIKGGENIHQLARDNAPRDTGALEDSITMSVPKQGLFQRKDIFIGVDPSKLGEGYAKYKFRYDQHLHDMSDDQFSPGVGSEAKIKSGKQVGPAYFTRALAELEKEIAAELEKIAKEESLI